jgi:uncharacterized protein (DUF433 family)
MDIKTPEPTPSALSDAPRYPLEQAARLTRTEWRAAQRWAHGFRFRPKRDFGRPMAGITSLRQLPTTGHHDLTFLDMLTLRVVRGLCGAGVQMPTVRRVAEIAEVRFVHPTPLVTRRFRDEGADLFTALESAQRTHRYPDDASESEPDSIEAWTWRQIFADVLERSLFGQIDWGDDVPARWWPMGRARSVVIDPCVLTGAPHLATARVPTAVIAADMSDHGGDEAAVAAARGVSVEQVRDALSFETEWLKPFDPKPAREQAKPVKNGSSRRWRAPWENHRNRWW